MRFYVVPTIRSPYECCIVCPSDGQVKEEGDWSQKNWEDLLLKVPLVSPLESYH